MYDNTRKSMTKLGLNHKYFLTVEKNVLMLFTVLMLKTLHVTVVMTNDFVVRVIRLPKK